MRTVAAALAPHAASVAALALLACVDRGPGPTPGADAALVSASLRQAPPAELAGQAAAALGDGVLYLGNVVEPTALVPGEPVTVRHFWQVLAPPGPSWRVFSHLRGAPGDPAFLPLDDTPLRRAHPPARWKAGQIFEDVQRFVLPAAWRSPRAVLLVGLAPRGRHRITERMPVVRGPAEGSAVVARQWPVDLTKAPPPEGTVVVRRTAAAVTIDGLGDEPIWQSVPWSRDFVAAEGGREPVGRARAKLAWDEQALYLFAHVEDPDVASPYLQRDEPLWKADCVEIFIDVDGNRSGYVELQVSPRNVHFDSAFATTRAQPGDLSYSSGMQSQVVVHGTLDDRGDTDVGWDLELAVPWAAMSGGAPPAEGQRPLPARGDRIRLNVVRVDKRATDQHVTAASWNRITVRDFHALDRMLDVILAE